MKKGLISLLSALVVFGMVGCSKPAEPVVAPFSAELEKEVSAYGGASYVDTYVFEGETTDGIITKLNFDIIRDRGTETEISKKDIMGYLMNVATATVASTENGITLQLDVNSYSNELGQYMITATAAGITAETTLSDLVYIGSANGGYSREDYGIETGLLALNYLGDELGLGLTAQTPVVDVLAGFGLASNGTLVEGSKRISFAGLNGGRSYGEQVDAIVAHILANNMTLEQVLEMFQTVNQMGVAIEDRDAISGATISFAEDFQEIVSVAINGK